MRSDSTIRGTPQPGTTTFAGEAGGRWRLYAYFLIPLLLLAAAVALVVLSPMTLDNGGPEPFDLCMILVAFLAAIGAAWVVVRTLQAETSVVTLSDQGLECVHAMGRDSVKWPDVERLVLAGDFLDGHETFRIDLYARGRKRPLSVHTAHLPASGMDLVLEFQARLPSLFQAKSAAMADGTDGVADTVGNPVRIQGRDIVVYEATGLIVSLPLTTLTGIRLMPKSLSTRERGFTRQAYAVLEFGESDKRRIPLTRERDVVFLYTLATLTGVPQTFPRPVPGSPIAKLEKLNARVSRFMLWSQGAIIASVLFEAMLHFVTWYDAQVAVTVDSGVETAATVRGKRTESDRGFVRVQYCVSGEQRLRRTEFRMKKEVFETLQPGSTLTLRVHPKWHWIAVADGQVQPTPRQNLAIRCLVLGVMCGAGLCYRLFRRQADSLRHQRRALGGNP